MKLAVCQSCGFWEVGKCSSEKFIDCSGGGFDIEADEIGFSDMEGWEVNFRTGPHFGCIHWFEQKEGVAGY